MSSGSRIQRGGTGSPGPLKNHESIGCLSNTDPDSLKITRLPSQHSMLGHHRHASKTPFKWADNGPIIVIFGSFLSQVIKVWPPLTKLSGSAHGSIANISISFFRWRECTALLNENMSWQITAHVKVFWHYTSICMFDFFQIKISFMNTLRVSRRLDTKQVR